MKHLRTGCDKIELTLDCVVPFDLLSALENAKKEANKLRSGKVWLERGGLKGHVDSKGRGGGYAYCIDEGLGGAQWAFTSSSKDWNVRCYVSSAMCQSEGIDGVEKYIFQQLESFGVAVKDVSISRIDIAADYLDEEKQFELSPDMFSCRGRVKKRVYKQGDETEGDDRGFCQIVWSGSRVETVTIGKVNNMQLCVYDKRAQVVKKGLVDVPMLWGMEPEKLTDLPRVWRSEFRLGKGILRDFDCLTFENLKKRLGDILKYVSESWRHLEHAPEMGENISRIRNSSFWSMVCKAFKNGFQKFSTGISRGDIVRVNLDKSIQCLNQNIQGCISTLAWLMHGGNLSHETAALILKGIDRDLERKTCNYFLSRRDHILNKYGGAVFDAC